MCSASVRSSHEGRNARRRGREPSTRRRGCEAATVVCKPPGGNRSHEPLIQCGTDRPRPWAMPRRSASDGPRRPPPPCELRPALRPMRANPRDGGRWNATADTARRREPERHTAVTNASRARRCAHDNGHDRHHRGARCRYHAELARALGCAGGNPCSASRSTPPRSAKARRCRRSRARRALDRAARGEPAAHQGREVRLRRDAVDFGARLAHYDNVGEDSIALSGWVCMNLCRAGSAASRARPVHRAPAAPLPA